MMERFLFVSPAFIALLIFRYMRNQQAMRNDKLRKRFWKREDDLMQLLSAKENKQKKEENEN